MDSLVVDDMYKRPTTKLKRHFCVWRKKCTQSSKVTAQWQSYHVMASLRRKN